MRDRWTNHDRNHLKRRNNEDEERAARARSRRKEIPRWRRVLLPLGEIAALNLEIEKAERAIKLRTELNR